ncbi:hypothetical protein LG047_15245 [Methylocystis sp. WRRC1]|uniref:hypothetical protein n=1 Tax=Methylocystis sp. WRRC1 TaxID=1732014 RepID=UPI001D153F28|nr:hypothetical protein [Methylocystis sp. WRRC1]MCC3246656.1 hypothetical protein [Methylocystis sp. WRRC1]
MTITSLIIAQQAGAVVPAGPAQSGTQLLYQGVWDASTNLVTPIVGVGGPLVSSVGNEGWMYRVAVAGSTNLDGVSAWGVNDYVVFLAGAWRKIAGA